LAGTQYLIPRLYYSVLILMCGAGLVLLFDMVVCAASVRILRTILFALMIILGLSFVVVGSYLSSNRSSLTEWLRENWNNGGGVDSTIAQAMSAFLDFFDCSCWEDASCGGPADIPCDSAWFAFLTKWVVQSNIGLVILGAVLLLQAVVLIVLELGDSGWFTFHALIAGDLITEGVPYCLEQVRFLYGCLAKARWLEDRGVSAGRIAVFLPSSSRTFVEEQLMTEDGVINVPVAPGVRVPVYVKGLIHFYDSPADIQEKMTVLTRWMLIFRLDVDYGDHTRNDEFQIGSALGKEDFIQFVKSLVRVSGAWAVP
jgi:hypothetical protein